VQAAARDVKVHAVSVPAKVSRAGVPARPLCHWRHTTVCLRRWRAGTPALL